MHGNLDKIIVQSDGLRAVKGVHSLVQWVERNKILWLELLLDCKNLQNSYFSKPYDINLYMYIDIVLCIEDGAQL
jgi:hypothetical protein